MTSKKKVQRQKHRPPKTGNSIKVKTAVSISINLSPAVRKLIKRVAAHLIIALLLFLFLV